MSTAVVKYKEFGDIDVPKKFDECTTFGGLKNPTKIRAFATHLRTIREGANMSQQDLADLADVSKKTIQRIENADNRVTLDTLFSVAEALDISMQKLFDY